MKLNQVIARRALGLTLVLLLLAAVGVVGWRWVSSRRPGVFSDARLVMTGT